MTPSERAVIDAACVFRDAAAKQRCWYRPPWAAMGALVVAVDALDTAATPRRAKGDHP